MIPIPPCGPSPTSMGPFLTIQSLHIKTTYPLLNSQPHGLTRSLKRRAGAIQQMNLDDVSPATRLLEKRRQMFEVQEALETQKEEFAR